MPREVLRNIYSFDPTFHVLYKEALKEIPDQIIYNNQKYSQFYNQFYNHSSCIHIRTFNVVNNLYISLKNFKFFYDFYSLVYIKPKSTYFTYNNCTLEEARQQDIDTRIKHWEWWLYLDQIIYISCSYKQDVGIIFEISNLPNQQTTHYSISKKEALELYKYLKHEMSKFNFNKIEKLSFSIPNRLAVIPECNYHYSA